MMALAMRDRSWSSSTARQSVMAPLLVLALCVALLSALLVLRSAPTQRAEQPDVSGRMLATGIAGPAAGAEALVGSSHIGEAGLITFVSLVDADNVLGEDAEEFARALETWLVYQGHAKRSLVKVSRETSSLSGSWSVRCSVSGAPDDVVAGKTDSGWGFGWAKVIAQREADAEAARKEAEEARAAEEAARETTAQEPAEEESWHDGGWQEGPDEVTYEEVFQEAYVEVYDVEGLSSYIPSPCASGLLGALSSWGEEVAGLRNADAAYLVASSVSGSDPCSFTVVIPSGMVDADLDWVDVAVSCSWSGGSYSFAL